MKLYKILVVCLLVVSNLVASEPKKGCVNPIGCQLYKACAQEYNRKYPDAPIIYTAQEDEVKDATLFQEVENLSRKISFVDKYGKTIQPVLRTIKTKKFTVYNGGYRLPLTECPDFVSAKELVKKHEAENPVGPLYLVEEFDFLGQNQFAGICTMPIQQKKR